MEGADYGVAWHAEKQESKALFGLKQQGDTIKELCTGMEKVGSRDGFFSS